MILPDAVPVMLLPQCNVFPCGLLPLFIFESRYRAMLAEALRTDRILCVGTLLPESVEPGFQEEDCGIGNAHSPREGKSEGGALSIPSGEEDKRIHPFSTAALIRACVGHPDGTSHIVLQGIQRVKFAAWEQHFPFRVARIGAVPTLDSSPELSSACAVRLLQRVLRLLRKNPSISPQVAARLETLTDPGHLADFIASHFISCAIRRHPLLAMTEISERLAYLESILTQSAEQEFPV